MFTLRKGNNQWPSAAATDFHRSNGRRHHIRQGTNQRKHFSGSLDLCLKKCAGGAPKADALPYCIRHLDAGDKRLYEKRNRLAQGRLNDMVFVKYNRALDRRCKNIDTADPILLKDIDESNEWLMGHMDGKEEPATNFVYVDDDLTWVAVDIASGASEPAYLTRASTSRGKGTAHTSTSGSKAYGLIDEDYEEDIGLSKDDGVNEELGIDVDDDEDD
ncbi:hypothetical protein Tco_0452780 [Tanacetum coccineum]